MGTIQLLSVYYYFMYFADNGYLPSPFVFDKSDSFMDLFHPMWWASNEGRYTEWASVYPPLNFILLNIVKWISLGGASFSDSFALRDAGYSIKVIFIFLYLLTPIIVSGTKSADLSRSNSKHPDAFRAGERESSDLHTYFSRVNSE
jgi:hypothetical protein